MGRGGGARLQQLAARKFLKASPRLNGLAVLPIQNPAEAVKELRRAVNELGMIGALMPAAGVERLLGHTSYEAIYQAAQDLDVALSVHTGGVPQLDMRLFDRLIDVRCLQHPIGQLHQMVNMMFSGVFDRFPTLRLAFLESGSAWVLCALERMQREFEHWSVLLGGHRSRPGTSQKRPTLLRSRARRRLTTLHRATAGR